MGAHLLDHCFELGRARGLHVQERVGVAGDGVGVHDVGQPRRPSRRCRPGSYGCGSTARRTPPSWRRSPRRRDGPVKPVITPSASRRSTRRFTAGADRPTPRPIAPNEARAFSTSCATICRSRSSRSNESLLKSKDHADYRVICRSAVMSCMERSTISTDRRGVSSCARPPTSPSSTRSIPGCTPSCRPTPGAAWRSGSTCAPPTSDAGHVVETITPKRGLPDMVFAANSALVIDGVALLARFRHPQRTGEERLVRALVPRPRPRRAPRPSTGTRARATSRSRATSSSPAPAFAPTSPRTARSQRVFGPRGRDARARRPALLPPRHRVVRARRRADRVLPGRVLRRQPRRARTPLPRRDHRRRSATRWCSAATPRATAAMCSCRPAPTASPRSLDARGFEPVTLDLSELRKAGGSVKCCTLELRGIGDAR